MDWHLSSNINLHMTTIANLSGRQSESSRATSDSASRGIIAQIHIAARNPLPAVIGALPRRPGARGDVRGRPLRVSQLDRAQGPHRAGGPGVLGADRVSVVPAGVRGSPVKALGFVVLAEGVMTFLAVQDGMTVADVVPHLPRYHGIFVGGSLRWKLETGAAWAELSRRHGMGCHIGRVGTAARVHWARSIGATSIDSALPLRAREHLDALLAAVGDVGSHPARAATPA